tara:strand:+ start:202 stop:447 length:246 start_codon:yes stop_codon:yes gene_type:complete
VQIKAQKKFSRRNQSNNQTWVASGNESQKRDAMSRMFTASVDGGSAFDNPSQPNLNVNRKTPSTYQAHERKTKLNVVMVEN